MITTVYKREVIEQYDIPEGVRRFVLYEVSTDEQSCRIIDGLFNNGTLGGSNNDKLLGCLIRLQYGDIQPKIINVGKNEHEPSGFTIARDMLVVRSISIDVRGTLTGCLRRVLDQGYLVTIIGRGNLLVVPFTGPIKSRIDRIDIRLP